ncbi:MAG: DMT family transporter [Planctomycetota bacterium]
MSAERRALSALLLGAVGIAFAPIFVRLSELEPTVTAFWRLALAAPLLWLAVRAEKTPAPPRRDWLRLAAPGLFFACDLGVWHWSIRYTTVANSTLLANLMPVFVTLFGWLLYGRRVTRMFVVGMAAALAGAAIMTGAKPENWFGDLLGVLTAVFYASYILSVGRLRAHYSTATILAWSTTAAALLLLPVCVAAGEGFVPPSLNGWLVLLGLAVVSHVLGQGLIAYALAHLPASFSAVTLLAQPVLASLLAWALFAEKLTPLQAAGGAIVLAGIVAARRASVRIQAT